MDSQIKEKNVPQEMKGACGIGDVYIWAAIDPESKLIASWFVPKRGADYAHEFIGDLKTG